MNHLHVIGLWFIVTNYLLFQSQSLRIVTKMDLDRAVIDRIKTDASFGHGKPRYLLSDRPMTDPSRNIDLAQLIRETLEDLSISHPHLRQPEPHKTEAIQTEPQTDSDAEVERDNATPTEKVIEEQPTVQQITTAEPPDTRESPLRMATMVTPTEHVAALPVCLPRIYSQRSRRLVRRDFTKRDVHKESQLTIGEAGVYHYIRKNSES